MNQIELETIIHFRNQLHWQPNLYNQVEQTVAEVIGFLNAQSSPYNLIKEECAHRFSKDTQADNFQTNHIFFTDNVSPYM